MSPRLGWRASLAILSMAAPLSCRSTAEPVPSRIAGTPEVSVALGTGPAPPRPAKVDVDPKWVERPASPPPDPVPSGSGWALGGLAAGGVLLFALASLAVRSSRAIAPGGGRRFALASGAAGLVVLAVAAFAARDGIQEEWCVRRLASQDGAIRKEAIERLREAGSRRAISALLDVVRTREAPEAKLAVRALLSMDPEGIEALSWEKAAKQHLVVLLNGGKDDPLAAAAARALCGGSGFGFRFVHADLLRATIDRSDDAARRSLVAQGKRLLTSGDHLDRADGARLLGYLGGHAPDAAPALVKALGDESEIVQRIAQTALRRIDEAEEAAAPASGR